MNPSDPATDFITRRDFMKKSALTVGAITLLSQGIGLASGTGGGSSYYVQGAPVGKKPPEEGDNYIWAPDLTVGDKTYQAKAATLTNPANGINASTVAISVALHSWIIGEVADEQTGWTITGSLSGENFTSGPEDDLSAGIPQKKVMATWVIPDSGRSETVRENHWVEAMLKVTLERNFPLYRQEDCFVSITHYQQEHHYINDEWEPVDTETVVATKKTEFSVSVQRKP